MIRYILIIVMMSCLYENVQASSRVATRVGQTIINAAGKRGMVKAGGMTITSFTPTLEGNNSTGSSHLHTSQASFGTNGSYNDLSSSFPQNSGKFAMNLSSAQIEALNAQNAIRVNGQPIKIIPVSSTFGAIPNTSGTPDIKIDVNKIVSNLDPSHSISGEKTTVPLGQGLTGFPRNISSMTLAQRMTFGMNNASVLRSQQNVQAGNVIPVSDPVITEQQVKQAPVSSKKLTLSQIEQFKNSARAQEIRAQRQNSKVLEGQLYDTALSGDNYGLLFDSARYVGESKPLVLLDQPMRNIEQMSNSGRKMQKNVLPVMSSTSSLKPTEQSKVVLEQNLSTLKSDGVVRKSVAEPILSDVVNSKGQIVNNPLNVLSGGEPKRLRQVRQEQSLGNLDLVPQEGLKTSEVLKFQSTTSLGDSVSIPSVSSKPVRPGGLQKNQTNNISLTEVLREVTLGESNVTSINSELPVVPKTEFVARQPIKRVGFNKTNLEGLTSITPQRKPKSQSTVSSGSLGLPETKTGQPENLNYQLALIPGQGVRDLSADYDIIKLNRQQVREKTTNPVKLTYYERMMAFLRAMKEKVLSAMGYEAKSLKSQSQQKIDIAVEQAASRLDAAANKSKTGEVSQKTYNKIISDMTNNIWKALVFQSKDKETT